MTRRAEAEAEAAAAAEEKLLCTAAIGLPRLEGRQLQGTLRHIFERDAREGKALTHVAVLWSYRDDEGVPQVWVGNAFADASNYERERISYTHDVDWQKRRVVPMTKSDREARSALHLLNRSIVVHAISVYSGPLPKSGGAAVSEKHAAVLKLLPEPGPAEPAAEAVE